MPEIVEKMRTWKVLGPKLCAMKLTAFPVCCDILLD